jgi:hypothetical protein
MSDVGGDGWRLMDGMEMLVVVVLAKHNNKE